MKIYARQISPEFQESPLFWDGPESWPEGITITGNREFQGRQTEEFEQVYPVLEGGELAEILDDLKTGGYWKQYYKNATEAITEYLSPARGSYTTKEIHALKELVNAFSTCKQQDENDIICSVLSLVTGQEYGWKIIRGSCQGDWQECFFPVEAWSREALDVLETEYFNTGTEWIIHDGEREPEQPEEIEGFSTYCYGWTVEKVKEEIRAAAGAGDSVDVVLYPFEGYARTAIYGEAV